MDAYQMTKSKIMSAILQTIGCELVQTYVPSAKPPSRSSPESEHGLEPFSAISKLATKFGRGIEKAKSLILRREVSRGRNSGTKLAACEYCNFKSDSILVLLHHKKVHTRTSSYTCRFCYQKMYDKNRFEAHLNKKHFYENRNYLNKIRRHNDEREMCDVDDFVFDERDRILNSDWDMSEIDDVPADNTNGSAEAENNVTANEQNRFRASNKTLPPAMKSMRHAIRRIEKKMNKLAISNEVPIKSRRPTATACPNNPNIDVKVCEICDHSFENIKLLRDHMLCAHKVKINDAIRPPLDCQKCYKRFFTDFGIMRHLFEHGLGEKQLINGQYTVKCPHCELFLVKNLFEHISAVHNIDVKLVNLTYKCTACYVTCHTMGEYKDHIRIHINNDIDRDGIEEVLGL